MQHSFLYLNHLCATRRLSDGHCERKPMICWELLWTEKTFDQYNHTGYDLLAKAARHSTQAGIQHEIRLRKLQPLLFFPGT